jgi:hypothetical protein
VGVPLLPQARVRNGRQATAADRMDLARLINRTSGKEKVADAL